VVAVSLFVPDTLYSLASGFWPNAVLNSVFALVFALPLWATRGLFLGTAAAPGGGRPSSPHP
jgi:integral membrane sensor domain MASE1